jgi:hypothetical protein
MKRFGIKFTLPAGDPMAAPHLLGSDWTAYRWYVSAAERDAVMRDARREHIYSRAGDIPSLVLEKVDREKDAA